MSSKTPTTICFKEPPMDYHSGLNIVVGLFVEFSSRWGGQGNDGWSHGLLGLFN